MAENRTVLVAGGAGFLGAAITDRLLRAGRKVVCLDDFSSGSEAAVAPFALHPLFTLVRADVRDPPDIAAAEIWNLACPADPTAWPRDPAFVLTTAVVGTEKLLRLAARHEAKFLQASTSEVYGDPDQHPQSESYPGRVDCCGPRACYEEGKRAAETLCAIAHSAGQDVRVARLFNVYGPGMRADDGRAVPSFLAAIRAGRAPVLFGDGTQTRSFCFLDDALDGLFGLMALPAAPAGPVNLGGAGETRLADLAAMLLRLAGSDLVPEHAPGRPGDPRRRRPDLRLARSLLGWQPVTSLETGLELTLRGGMIPGRTIKR